MSYSSPDNMQPTELASSMSCDQDTIELLQAEIDQLQALLADQEFRAGSLPNTQPALDYEQVDLQSRVDELLAETAEQDERIATLVDLLEVSEHKEHSEMEETERTSTVGRRH